MTIDLSTYSFCEPTHAGPLAPWCIRKLSRNGRKVGGGVDTYSLCGRVKPCDVGGSGGWDLPNALVADYLDDKIACRKCLAKLRELETIEGAA